MCCALYTGARVTRWTVPLVALVLIVGFFGAGLTRALGWSGSRASSLVSVVSQWLAAWALWSLAGGLAVRAGLLDVYEPSAFTAVALVAGIWHYRTVVRSGRERGRVIFVGVQLVWLAVLLVRNGVFKN
jgi:hypothetical protein